MPTLRVLAVATAVLIGGAYVVQYLATQEYGLRWPMRARAERAFERVRQRGATVTGKTAAAASKIVAKTEAAAIRLGDKTSAAATRIGDKASSAATKIADKTSDAATKVERRVNETTLSAKIKTKMALDDNIKA